MTRTLTLSGRGRRGFTLVEMLVVIVIIGILAALLIPAVYRAIIAAREAALKVELKSLEQAVEAYRAKYGQYPPDFTDQLTVNRHFKSIFSRSVDAIPSGLTRAQALVFCLQGFSSDPLHPFTGAGQRTPLFDFDQARLVVDPSTMGGTVYVPRSLTMPYVYFDARTYYVNKSSPFTPVTGLYNPGSHNLSAYGANGGCAPFRNPDNTFCNPKSFQIVCAGLDDNYGSGSPTNGLVFPSGIMSGSLDSDNVVSFNERSTLQGDLQ